MRYLWLIIVVLLVIGFLAWQVWFSLLIGVKELPYKVIAQKDGYELREIKERITAHVDLVGSYEQTAREGFKILYDYISGNNNARKCLPLREPFLHQGCSQTIAMTAPVIIEQEEPSRYRIAFVLPQGYTLENAPLPRDQRIILEIKPAHKVAVYPFNGYPSQDRIMEAQSAFKKLLDRDGMRMQSAVAVARYNPPFILPLFMRNELMVVVQEQQEKILS